MGQEIQDTHNAFDQVFREGITYLLYGHGVRGEMLKMLTRWINTNITTHLWRGHIGDEVKLDDNGIRQGCNLSPILYLIVINTLVSEEPSCEIPEWDKKFKIHTKRLTKYSERAPHTYYIGME